MAIYVKLFVGKSQHNFLKKQHLKS